jgi:hypothetical protein
VKDPSISFLPLPVLLVAEPGHKPASQIFFKATKSGLSPTHPIRHLPVRTRLLANDGTNSLIDHTSTPPQIQSSRHSPMIAIQFRTGHHSSLKSSFTPKAVILAKPESPYLPFASTSRPKLKVRQILSTPQTTHLPQNNTNRHGITVMVNLLQ